MQCNIDQRGRRIRMFSGVAQLTLAVVAAAVALFGGFGAPAWLLWVLAAMLLAGGVFSIFEARKGWCVVRAMGFKTPV